MKPEQLWVVPSRARPTRLRLMLSAGLGLSAGLAGFAVCIDDDDPSMAGYDMVRAWAGEAWPGRVDWTIGARGPVTALVNRAAEMAPAGAAVGFLGDDHLPKPSRDDAEPWDAALSAVLAGGAPFAYGDDLHQSENLPTAVLARRGVVDALGWLCLPSLAHYWFDNVWRDLGAVYEPRVVIEHRHHMWRTAARDATYADAEPLYEGDKAAYEAWRSDGGGMAADMAAVRDALKAPA